MASIRLGIATPAFWAAASISFRTGLTSAIDRPAIPGARLPPQRIPHGGAQALLPVQEQ